MIVLQDIIRQIRLDRDQLQIELEHWMEQTNEERLLKEEMSVRLESLICKQQEQEQENSRLVQEINISRQDFKKEKLYWEDQLSRQKMVAAKELEEQELQWVQKLQQQQQDSNRTIAELKLRIQEMEQDSLCKLEELRQIHSQELQNSLARQQEEWKLTQQESMQIASAAVQAAQAREQKALSQSRERQQRRELEFQQRQEQLEQRLRDQSAWNDELQKQIGQLLQSKQQPPNQEHHGRPSIWKRIRRKLWGTKTLP